MTALTARTLDYYSPSIALMLASVVLTSPAIAGGLVQLDDDILRKTTGQVLFNTSYTAPSEANNPNPNIGIYQLGMDVDLELNANIRRLSLGCNGVNGAGCDIDIENLRLSGFAVDAAKQPINDRGPQTSLLARNPFFEFAIRNPDQASTREIVGMRLGFKEAFGLLSLGDFNGIEGNAASQSNPANHTGINRLAINLNQVVLNDITFPVTICSGGVNAGRTACAGPGLPIPIIGGLLPSVPITNGEAQIIQDTPAAGDNRFRVIATPNNSLATTQGNTQVFNSIQNFGGTDYQRLQLHNIRAVVSGLGGIPIGGLGAISNNIGLNVTFNETFNFIHQLPLGADNNSNGVFDAGDTTTKDLYFSLTGIGDNNVNNRANWLNWQSTAMAGTWAGAPRGWSLGSDEARLEGFTTAPVFLSAAEAIGGAANTPILATNIDLLQRPVDNCFGSLTFC